MILQQIISMKVLEMRTDNTALQDMIYQSLRQGTVPSPDAVKDLRKRYSDMTDDTLEHILNAAKKRIENEKDEMGAYLNVEMNEINSDLSQLERTLDGKISIETVNSIDKFETRIAESQKKYSHLEGDSLFASMLEDYSLFLDGVSSKAASIRDGLIATVNSSFDSLLSKYGSIQIVPDNLTVLKDMKNLSNEHKEIMSKMGMNPRIAVDLSKGIDESISIIQEMIITEKKQEQSLYQQRDRTYQRFTELRSDYYDDSKSADIQAIHEECLELKSMMGSYSDIRVGEVDIFLNNLEKCVQDKDNLRSGKAKSIFKKAAAAAVLIGLSYCAISIGAAGLGYINSSIDSAKERKKAETASALYSQQSQIPNQQRELPASQEAEPPAPQYAAPASSGAPDNQAQYEPPRVPRENLMMGMIADLDPNIEYIVYIQKNAGITSLYEVNSGTVSSRPVNSWNSIDGKGGNGPKEQDGDFKTPEGIYRIRAMKWIKTNEPMFGPVAIQIDYPNGIDQNLGRTGGQAGNSILICGTYLDERLNALNNGQDVTNGSIVLKPDDAIQLANTIESRINKTVVVIEGNNAISSDYIRGYFSR
ncbi:MAG: L,D-transpeptidase family protein [Candidatus Woesearchaeota archaeon]|nr:L,D-transpeptidase family protein [Candidatus Woesearchaeota archaeon]